jgi:hypothetical protein
MSEINCMGKLYIYTSLHKRKSAMLHVDDKIIGAYMKTVCTSGVC